MLKEKYANLTPWQRVQVARHPDRPHSSDYIEKLFSEFIPLSGDRKFVKTMIMGGLATFEDTSIMLIGQEKGSDTESRLKKKFWYG